MRAAPGDDGMDLVHDHGLDVAQRLARGGREHQVQRLRRRDEDVGRRLREARALLRRSVAGADRDGRLADVQAEPFGRVTDARDRRAKVALDVDRERLQRRDVDDAAAARGRLTGLSMDESGTPPAFCPTPRAP